jgi:hypothetical protein
VSKDGYTTYSASLDGVPAAGETIDLYATLNPTVPATPVVIGGNQGWYKVNCNVDGAQVTFDNDVKGVITQGSLTVPVYTTGTPYQTYSVSAPGYVTYTSTVTQFPAKGETINLYATLNPQPTPVPATKSPLPLEISCAAVVIGALGMVIAGRKNS